MSKPECLTIVKMRRIHKNCQCVGSRSLAQISSALLKAPTAPKNGSHRVPKNLIGTVLAAVLHKNPIADGSFSADDLQKKLSTK